MPNRSWSRHDLIITFIITIMIAKKKYGVGRRYARPGMNGINGVGFEWNAHTNALHPEFIIPAYPGMTNLKQVSFEPDPISRLQPSSASVCA
jgi:hypothetical protein